MPTATYIEANGDGPCLFRRRGEPLPHSCLPRFSIVDCGAASARLHAYILLAAACCPWMGLAIVLFAGHLLQACGAIKGELEARASLIVQGKRQPEAP
jgi:hypothetical protein